MWDNLDGKKEESEREIAREKEVERNSEHRTGYSI